MVAVRNPAGPRVHVASHDTFDAEVQAMHHHSAQSAYIVLRSRCSRSFKCSQSIPEPSAPALRYFGHEHRHVVPHFALFDNTTTDLVSGSGTDHE